MTVLSCLTVLAVVALKAQATHIHLCSGLPPVLRINDSLGSTEFERQTPESIERLIFNFVEDHRLPGAPVDGRFFDFLSERGVPESTILSLSGPEASDYREGEHYQSYLKDGHLCVTIHLNGLGHFRVLLVRELGNLNVSIRVHPWNCPNLLSPCWPDQLELDYGIWLISGYGQTTLMASFIQRQIELGKRVHIFEQYSEYLFEGAASQNALGTDSPAWRRERDRLVQSVAEGGATNTLVVIDELQHPSQIKFAVDLAQRGVTVLAGHYARDIASLMNQLADRSSRPTFQRLLLRLAGIVSQCRVATTSDKFAAALKLLLVNSINRPHLSDPFSVDESKLKYRIALDDSLILLVEAERVEIGDALCVCEDLERLKKIFFKEI